MVSSYKQPSHVGVIKRSTVHFDLEVPYFDTPGWGQYIEEDLDTIDALLYGAVGISNVKGIWANATAYAVGDRVLDNSNGQFFQCVVAHMSAATGTFEEDRLANPTFWILVQTTWNFRGAWAPLTFYQVGDVVYDEIEHVVAVCSVSHTSTSDIRTDAANWDFIVDLANTVDQAETAAAEAAASAAAAAISEANAAISAGAASVSEDNAAISEVNSAASAAAALVSETNAAASEAAAHADMLAADADAASASADADAAQAALDQFTDLYLGPKANDPLLDNDGNALQDGAIYWNTTTKTFRVYDQDTGLWYAASTSSTGTFASDVTIDKSTPQLILNTDPADQYASVVYQRDGVNRWMVSKDADTESGADNGSNFEITAWSDAGVLIGNAMEISRKTLNAFLGGNLTVGGTITSVLGGVYPTKTYVDDADALRVLKVGDTMSGFLNLHANPTDPAHAARKAYVDTGDAAVTTAFQAADTALQTNINGKVAKIGDTMTGDLTLVKVSPSIILDKAASGQGATLVGKKGALFRWVMALGNSAAEAGANAGSDFAVNAFDDAGNIISTPQTIRRSDGQATFTGNILTTASLISRPAAPAAAGLFLDKAGSGQISNIAGRSVASAYASRWGISLGDEIAEAGANAGSNFAIDRYADAGAYLGRPFAINRATGLIELGSGQLQFPATPNPINNANILDEYKEGTWTVVWTGASTNGTLNNGTLTGVYTKIGRMVTAQISLVIGSTTVVPTGTWGFSLPFTAANTQYLHGSGAAMFIDSGTGYLNGIALGLDATKIGGISGGQLISQAFPMVWAVNDQMAMAVTYPALN